MLFQVGTIKIHWKTCKIIFFNDKVNIFWNCILFKIKTTKDYIPQLPSNAMQKYLYYLEKQFLWFYFPNSYEFVKKGLALR